MRLPNTQSWQFVAGSYFGFLFFPLFALSVIVGGISWLFPASLIMVAVPALDLLTGEDLTPSHFKLSSPQRWLTEAAPVFFVLGNAATIGIAAHIFAHLTISEKFFAILSVGMISSIGITAAHELVHKSQRLTKIFGRLGLANVLYLHFEINHIRGHHVRVGTSEDHSTAWLGESLYHFLFRTVPGCFKASWYLERERLRRKTAATLGFRNQMLQFAILQTVYIAAIWFFGDWQGVVLFSLQASIAVFMLESVSYIEHYGLLRAKGADGKHEPMSPEHSWDCYGRFSNYLVFQLQRHADHHSHPTRALFDLQTAGNAPKLPVGYPLLIGVAMVPPLWKKIMDSRVSAFRYERSHKV